MGRPAPRAAQATPPANLRASPRATSQSTRPAENNRAGWLSPRGCSILPLSRPGATRTRAPGDQTMNVQPSALQDTMASVLASETSE